MNWIHFSHLIKCKVTFNLRKSQQKLEGGSKYQKQSINRVHAVVLLSSKEMRTRNICPMPSGNEYRSGVQIKPCGWHNNCSLGHCIRNNFSKMHYIFRLTLKVNTFLEKMHTFFVCNFKVLELKEAIFYLKWNSSRWVIKSRKFFHKSTKVASQQPTLFSKQKLIEFSWTIEINHLPFNWKYFKRFSSCCSQKKLIDSFKHFVVN